MTTSPSCCTSELQLNGHLGSLTVVSHVVPGALDLPVLINEERRSDDPCAFTRCSVLGPKTPSAITSYSVSLSKTTRSRYHACTSPVG
jgi:hypothetical protein